MLVGTSSWTDPTLVRDSGFYPKRSMSAEERLRFYASIFTAVEVDATFYAPPSLDVTRAWAERTPGGFRMDVKAYALFTQHPARAEGMWRDLRSEIPGEHRGRRHLYLHNLPHELVEAAWARFDDALRPLHGAGRLGAVVFQFPPWFVAKRANRAYLADLPGRLPDYRLAVEFRHGSWLGESDRERTLTLLEQLGLAYVCVDEPQGFKTSVPPVVAATADLAIVRFHGQNAETWTAKGLTPAERFRYLYSEDELGAWVGPLRDLSRGAAETHALMNNCYRDFGVRNAYQLGHLLGEGLQPGAPEVSPG